MQYLTLTIFVLFAVFFIISLNLAFKIISLKEIIEVNKNYASRQDSRISELVEIRTRFLTIQNEYCRFLKAAQIDFVKMDSENSKAIFDYLINPTVDNLILAVSSINEEHPLDTGEVK